jgi:hypothetical protein
MHEIEIVEPSEHPPAHESYFGQMDAQTAEDGTLPTMQIFVKTLFYKTITLYVRASDTHVEIKAMISAKLRLIFTQPSDYYMTFQSRVMADNRTLICILFF